MPTVKSIVMAAAVGILAGTITGVWSTVLTAIDQAPVQAARP